MTTEPTDGTVNVLGQSIDELNLSARGRKGAAALGVETIGHLVNRTSEEFLELKNFGVTSLKEIREKLAERNLKLRGE